MSGSNNPFNRSFLLDGSSKKNLSVLVINNTGDKTFLSYLSGKNFTKVYEADTGSDIYLPIDVDMSAAADIEYRGCTLDDIVIEDNELGLLHASTLSGIKPGTSIKIMALFEYSDLTITSEIDRNLDKLILKLKDIFDAKPQLFSSFVLACVSLPDGISDDKLVTQTMSHINKMLSHHKLRIMNEHILALRPEDSGISRLKIIPKLRMGDGIGIAVAPTALISTGSAVSYVPSSLVGMTSPEAYKSVTLAAFVLGSLIVVTAWLKSLDYREDNTYLKLGLTLILAAVVYYVINASIDLSSKVSHQFTKFLGVTGDVVADFLRKKDCQFDETLTIIHDNLRSVNISQDQFAVILNRIGLFVETSTTQLDSLGGASSSFITSLRDNITKSSNAMTGLVNQARFELERTGKLSEAAIATLQAELVKLNSNYNVFLKDMSKAANTTAKGISNAADLSAKGFASATKTTAEGFAKSAADFGRAARDGVLFKDLAKADVNVKADTKVDARASATFCVIQ